MKLRELFRDFVLSKKANKILDAYDFTLKNRMHSLFDAESEFCAVAGDYKAAYKEYKEKPSQENLYILKVIIGKASKITCFISNYYESQMEKLAYYGENGYEYAYSEEVETRKIYSTIAEKIEKFISDCEDSIDKIKSNLREND